MIVEAQPPLLTTQLVTATAAHTLSNIAATVFRDAYRSAFESDRQVEEFIATNLSPTALRSEIESGQTWYLLGLVDRMAVGFLKLERSLPPECVGCRPSIELAKLYVLKAFHGGGIANTLMQRGVEHAQRFGVTQMWLCVWEKNPRAQAFYRRWGFGTVGDMSIPWSGVVFRDLVMTRHVDTMPATSSQSCKKIDAPFVSDAELKTLVDRFEACTWPYDRWTHRAHLAVGAFYAREYPFDEALRRLRLKINSYNVTCGDPTGYNETVTILFLRKIAASFCESTDARPLCEVVEEFVHCCSVGWLYEYYSRDRIWSAAAKSTWIAPDLKPLDF